MSEQEINLSQPLQLQLYKLTCKFYVFENKALSHHTHKNPVQVQVIPISFVINVY